MKRVYFGDFLVLAVILGLAIFSFKDSFLKKGDIVSVQAAGNTYEFSLEKNGIHKVEGVIGTTTIEIKDKKVRIVDSPCPNKTCVNQNWGSPLVCLPNNVIVRVISDGGLDAIAE